MTNRDKYIELCAQASLPLHAQAYWWQACGGDTSWDVLLIESQNGSIEAALPYLLIRRYGLRALLMPVHTQYAPLYVSAQASEDIYTRLAQQLEDTCRSLRIGWVNIQGFYPDAFLKALEAYGFTLHERVTYRIPAIPSESALVNSFSENKRRQLRRANGLRLVDLSVNDFYAFHQTCWSSQGKRIDFSQAWAQSVLPTVIQHQQGRLLAAQDENGQLLAALFLAWDKACAYYLLPVYNPSTKDRGGVAWLTAQALRIAREKGLAFDFEGSMTPSIASSYKQFGGEAVPYHRVEKIYNPFIRMALWLRQRL